MRFIQISDIHMFGSKDDSLLGVNTLESFTAVVDLIKKEKMDFIILSGDLSQDGSEASYIRIADMLKDFNVPIYYVPGNHDDVDVMLSVFPRHSVCNDKQIILKDWQIILLNSQVPGCVEGSLNISQLNFMQECLQQYPERQAVIVCHHHPFSIQSGWLDQIGITNAEAFWQVLANYPNVNTLLFGHIHQVVEKEVNGIKCFSLPATCFQFKGKQDNFGLEHLNPGYRWVELFDNGKVETGIVRTAKYIGQFDSHSRGYA